MKLKKKYFIFEIPEEIRKLLKIKAAESNMTMRRYILRALIEKIKRDETYTN